MKTARTLTELLRRLGAGQIVPLTTDHWIAWSDGFTVVATERTTLAGDLAAVRWSDQGGELRWGLVEQPEPGRQVVRPLADEAAVRALMADRLAAYERMWDG